MIYNDNHKDTISVIGDIIEVQKIEANSPEGIDVATVAPSVTYETPDLSDFSSASLEIVVKDMIGGETVELFYSNVGGVNSGTVQATETLSAGDSNNIFEVSSHNCRFLRVVFSGLTTGTIEQIFLTAKRG